MFYFLMFSSLPHRPHRDVHVDCIFRSRKGFSLPQSGLAWIETSRHREGDHFLPRNDPLGVSHDRSGRGGGVTDSHQICNVWLAGCLVKFIQSPFPDLPIYHLPKTWKDRNRDFFSLGVIFFKVKQTLLQQAFYCTLNNIPIILSCISNWTYMCAYKYLCSYDS